MKKGILTVAVILVIGLSWYLFIKPQDYRINVKTKSRIGTINQTLKLWNTTLDGQPTLVQQETLKHLSQKITFADSTHQYEWYIEPSTDSTANIKVDVTDVENSITNKLKIPFSDTDFEKRSRKTVKEFLNRLKEHEESFKIKITDIEELASSYCACVSIESTQFEKAEKMMEFYPFMNSVLTQNGIKLNGVPFIEIKNWNIQNDKISYDFCYPIIEPRSLPIIKNVSFKTFTGQKSLKAIYNGNYITSDRAWYALLDYAEANTILVKPTPIEFFFNNPNFGDDALRWKTEVFLPLEEQDD